MTSPSILLLKEEPSLDWDRFVPIFCILFSIYSLIASHQHFATVATIEAVEGTERRTAQAQVTFVEKPRFPDYIKYAFVHDGETREDEWTCRYATVACSTIEVGQPLKVWVSPDGEAVPTALRETLKPLKKRHSSRGQTALATALFLAIFPFFIFPVIRRALFY